MQKKATNSAPPPVAAALAECEPEYVEVPGWQTSTAGISNASDLPQAARDYVAKIEELVGVPVTVISTGPDRNETILVDDPLA